MSIRRLPEHLVNRIAAGEVVERPASALKELVENAIDAGATRIAVKLAGGGTDLIEVTDDGCGMSPPEMALALERHATSKLPDDEIDQVTTLGFRGEALPSIASVARMTLESRVRGAEGWSRVVDNGALVSEGPAALPPGTRVRVEALFGRVPARRKFLRSPRAEYAASLDVMKRLAMARPDIAFSVEHDGRRALQVQGGETGPERVAGLTDRALAENSVAVDFEREGITLGGVAGLPTFNRGVADHQYLFVNGRPVKDRLLIGALRGAYAEMLARDRHPVVALFLDVPPDQVDVNVHPTKLEVRFSKDRELFTAIEETIKQKFREITLIPEMERKVTPKEKSVQHTMNFDNPVVERERENGGLQSKEQLVKYNPPVNEVREPDASSVEYEEKYTATKDEADTEESFPAASYIETPVVEQQPIEVDQQRVPTMYPIGQLQGTYILAQNENGLYMIDQHAAQERIKYEFFKEKLGKPMNESQELLLPMTFEFSKREAIFIEQYKESFEKVGLFFEAFGNQTYVIRSHPNWFPIGFEEEVIREMVEQIMNEEKVNVELIREEAAILMSCKRSIKANHYLKQEEMFRLLEDLRTTTDPFTCPHGRPIIVHFSTYELEKMFKRVM